MLVLQTAAQFVAQSLVDLMDGWLACRAAALTVACLVTLQ